MKTFLYSIIGIILGLIFNFYYNNYIDISDIVFTTAAIESDKWNEQLRKTSEPCNIFTGGSEVRLSLHPKIMLEKHGVRAISGGGNAGYGKACNALVALHYIKPGDKLYLSLRDVDIFQHSKSNLVTTGGLKYCFRRLGFKMFSTKLIDHNIKSLQQIFFGSTERLSMFISSIILMPSRLNKWKEHVSIHEDGWVEQLDSPKITHRNYNPILSDIQIPDEYLNFLVILKEEVEKKGGELILYTNAHYANLEKEIPYMSIIIKKLIDKGFKILNVKHHGCEDDASCFSDSPDHLSMKGARKWSIHYAECIKHNKFSEK